MSSAANHRKRSHRSEANHRQATVKRNIVSIGKQNNGFTPFSWLREKRRTRREKKANADGN